MRILTIGDIVSSDGREYVYNNLGKIRRKYNIDYCIANGENSALTNGITVDIARSLIESGVDVITMGNHTFANKESATVLNDFERVIRPINFPPETEGEGYYIEDLGNVRIAVINAMGRINMEPLDCPFRETEKVLERMKSAKFTVDAVRRSIKGMMLSSIKESIAAVIIEKKISILDISTRLSEIATEIQDKINAKIADLGLECDHFSVNSIMARDGDLDELRKMKAKTMALTSDADLEAYRIRTLSAARAQARATEGYTYADERRFDVLEGAAKNEGGAGGFINMGVGLGVGMGVGGEVGRMAQSAMQSNVAAQTAAADASGKVCPGCGASVAANAKFCPNCGQAQPSGPRFCPECGARVADGGKFCGECGTKLV